DTGDTDEIWAIARELPNLKALFIECSYPNRLSRQADLYGHLCPESVLRQAQKVGRDVDVYVYHIKAAHVEEVLSEISALDSNRIVAADPMRVYEF
ncbi:MAG: hypothetical protein JNN15_06255, partial [Blastocatellia bacterium]|nr:hypothetical protein [Blastocatellia bacterium]